MKIHLLSIDPQNDFVLPTGALSVPGAEDDMKRLAKFVKKNIKRIDDIHVTLDSHQPLHIAHPISWVNSNGEHPDPFTLISVDDVEGGTWMCAWDANWGLEYVKNLAVNGRYVLCIWPPHCLIGTTGSSIYEEFHDSIREWAEERTKIINYVPKGSNCRTEHYSAVKADVLVPSDPTTQLNGGIIGVLQNPEIEDILISGEALSHCVKNTVEDIADNFGEENIKKFVLLEDTCSNVAGFEGLGEQFVKEMSVRGMRVTTTEDYL
jgi:nicotinamidase-related amidase